MRTDSLSARVRFRVLGVARRGALCVSLVAVLGGCPGTLDDEEKQQFEAWVGEHPGGGAAPTGDAGAPSMPGDPCADVPTRIFGATCGGTGCHSATAPQQDLDLVSPGVAARVVGKPGKACLQTLADPQNPDGSLLYVKLLPGPACGAQMPLARPPLSSADIACVRSWIAAQ
jgi:hypothetical protein